MCIRDRSLFSQWASVLAHVGEQAGAKVRSLGPAIHGEAPGEGVKGQFAELVQQLNRETQKPLWVAFIGHGTYDGELARFNVKGPDISHLDLVSWFEPIERPLALINTTSASAPFLKELSGPGRVILTATRDGFELNFARFGVEAVKSAAAALRENLTVIDNRSTARPAWPLTVLKHWGQFRSPLLGAVRNGQGDHDFVSISVFKQENRLIGDDRRGQTFPGLDFPEYGWLVG